MIPAAFDYLRATTVEEALSIMVERGAVPLAGGHSLLVDMKRRRTRPGTVVDVSRLGELRGVRTEDGDLVVGAAVTYAELERSEDVARRAPVLARSAAAIGDRQVRARGTIGGSVVYADPAADLPATLLALDAVYVLQGPAGRREVPAAAMHPGGGATAASPGELLVEVRVPGTTGQRWSYQKFRQRSHQWAVVGVVACTGAHHDGVSIGLMGMTGAAARARASERAVAEGASVREAASLAAEGIDVTEDLRASARYRGHVARVMTGRALAEVSAA